MLFFSLPSSVLAMDDLETANIDRNQLIAETVFADIQIMTYKTEENDSIVPFCVDGQHLPVYTLDRIVGNTEYGIEIYSDGSFITSEAEDIVFSENVVNAYTAGARYYVWNLPHSASMGIRVDWQRNTDTNALTITSASSYATNENTVVIGHETISVAPGVRVRTSSTRAYREFGIHTYNASTGNSTSSYGTKNLNVVNNELVKGL